MPFNRKEYPANWEWLSEQVKKREGNRCYFCQAENGKPHWLTESKVVLTVHHIDGDKSNSQPLNLVAVCQRCHLRLDQQRHIKAREQNVKNRRARQSSNFFI